MRGNCIMFVYMCVCAYVCRVASRTGILLCGPRPELDFRVIIADKELGKRND